MSEEKLTSNKLDIELKRQSLKNSEDNRESYKPISEFNGVDQANGDTVKNSNMVRENAENAPDGADEKMLGSDDKETLALKEVEVKFIAASDPNGDAKIEIESPEKTFTGMTKEELMKYANDPFWVKLRWFLFVLFWLAWIGMLVGAVLIIVNAPKCAAPTPLSWYKEGPLVTVDGNADDTDIEKLVQHEIRGVIYELPDVETYLVDTPAVQERIKKMVEKYKAKDIHFVIDLTPNYVTKDDELVKKALGNDDESRKAFVTFDKELNWRKVSSEAKAWELNGDRYYLKQFGDNFDLRLDNPVAQEKFKNVLTSLSNIGVRGFRLANAKHFIIKDGGLNEEKPGSFKSKFNLNQYGFYEHVESTYRDGLGQMLLDFNRFIHNITNGEGFLTIKDDLSNHVNKYTVGESLGFELPRFGFINSVFHEPNGGNKAKTLKEGFDFISKHVGTQNWMQIEYSPKAYAHFNEVAFKLFVGLMNGVQISSLKDLIYVNNSTDVFTKLQKEHKSPVFQHGDFEYYLSEDEKAFAYSRIKSGNPGYFVVVNPSNETIHARFNETSVLGSDLTYLMASFSEMPKKADLKDIILPEHSTAVFTFVPK